MIHAREDYNRFQDPALDDPTLLGEGCVPIGKDEPVILFRASDENFIPILQEYRNRTWDTARPIADKINEHIDRARRWQAEHGTKTPDLPKG